MADPVGWFDETIAPAGWFSETAQPGGWFDRTLVEVGASGGLNGVVDAASSATLLSTPAGTQTHAGSVAAASSATSLSTPAGTQTYVGVVDGATSATSLQNPAGTQTHTGIASPLSTATTLSDLAGTQSYAGAVDGAVTATSLSTPAGTLGGLTGTVAGATSATELSTPAGSLSAPPSGALGFEMGGDEQPSRKRRGIVYVVQDEGSLSSAATRPAIDPSQARAKAEAIIRAAATEHASTRVSRDVRFGNVRASLKPIEKALGGFDWVSFYKRAYDNALVDQLRIQEQIADQIDEDAAIAILLLGM